jgi:unsaturated rhamnogalacturonyl hydrolase
MTNRIFLFMCLTYMQIAVFAQQKTQKLPTKAQTIEIIKKVNGYWQASNPEHGNAFWHHAAYHTGNMAAYHVTGMEDYRKYSEAWAEKNLWKGAKSDDTAKWRYSYGETNDFVLFGDWQICFQTYIDLYKLAPEDRKISRARGVMEYEMSTARSDYWWWVDGLYMVMPVMTKLYSVTKNDLYLKKLYEYFTFSRNLMYDKESCLFYRDAKYIYPKHKTNKGLKDFWARGNGWIFAAIPKVLEDLPKNDPNRAEFIQIYQDMAKSLAQSQQADGYWTRSILDAEQAPGPETSGTAFFTYGYLWGINNGLLKRKTYLPVVTKSWKYLSEMALQADGRLGFVQPIGEKAIPGQVIDKNSTADFGVGAFLLAASEMVKFAKK